MGSQHRWLFWQPAISTFACGNKVLFCSTLLIDVFFIDDMCVVFIFNFFTVIVGRYVDIYIFTLSSAAVHVL